MHYKYGKFSSDGSEFIVTNPATPRAFDNFLWNGAMFSNVQQTGVGYCDYQVGEGEAVQLLTGIGRVCDFDVFGRDGLMSRLIYIRDNDTGEFWNVNWEPARVPYESYECAHGMGYSIIRNVTKEIAVEFRIFVPLGKDPCECWSLTLRNGSRRKRSLSLFVYNQFQFKFKWGFESYGDMIFRGSTFRKELNAVVAVKHPHKKPHNFLVGFLTSDIKPAGWDGSRDGFAGIYNSLQEPEAVVRGKCSGSAGSSDATVGVLQFDLVLKRGESRRIEMLLGATDSESGIRRMRRKYLGRMDEHFVRLKKNAKKTAELNKIETPDKHLNRLMNYWIKQEAMFGAKWCRWGWMGYRDIVQHGFGVSSLDPTRTREILLEALRYQYRNGMALRGWNPVDTKPYSDSALWLVFTLVAYLQETADFDVLKEKVPYYDGGKATVRAHIDQALSFLEKNKGERGLILIKFGDWNDSLTAVGKDGRGESVWLSEAYAEAMQQMAGLSDHLGEIRKSAEYRMRYKKIKDAINRRAWDGQWYVRCFDDSGKRIGSSRNKYGKMFMEAQAWAIIAGIAGKTRREKMLEAMDKICLTPFGYALLAPTFLERDESVGRISCLEPGICENGTIYSHVNAWVMLGLLRSNMPDKAYDVFKRVAPGYVTGANDRKHKSPPFVVANCYYGPDHRSHPFIMEFTWITGSVAWFYNVILKDLLGAKADYAGLRIDPRLPSKWKEASVRRSFRGAIYDIVVKNPQGIGEGRVVLTVDGKKIDGNLVPVFSDGKTHKVEAVLESRGIGD